MSLCCYIRLFTLCLSSQRRLSVFVLFVAKFKQLTDTPSPSFVSCLSVERVAARWRFSWLFYTSARAATLALIWYSTDNCRHMLSLLLLAVCHSRCSLFKKSLACCIPLEPMSVRRFLNGRPPFFFWCYKVTNKNRRGK